VPFPIDLEFELLTPTYLGGADSQPEWRAASIKGALRFWYRAIDPDFSRHEDRIFGSVHDDDAGGQGAILLVDRLPEGDPKKPPPPAPTWSWRNFDKLPYEVRDSPPHNGFVYLGYPFGLRGNEGRLAFAPGLKRKLRVVVLRDEHEERVRRGLLAAIWLLGTVGGLGSRSRRGFGSLCFAASPWPKNLPPAWKTDAEALPFLAGRSPTLWLSGLKQTLRVFQGWFGSWMRAAGHPHFGPGATSSQPASPAMAAFGSSMTVPKAPPWANALAGGGLTLSKFRRKRAPDLGRVVGHLAWLGKSPDGRQMEESPHRAAFGLPLTFRMGNLGELQFFPPAPSGGEKASTRHASLLHLRVVKAGGQLLPLFLNLAGRRPGHRGTQSAKGAGSQFQRASTGVDLTLTFLQSLPGVQTLVEGERP